MSLCVFLSFNTYGQQEGSIREELNFSGKVMDLEDSSYIAFANVVLYKLPDSTLVTGVTTNRVGYFSLKLPNNLSISLANKMISIDSLYLKVSFVGYLEKTLRLSSLHKSHNTITLNRDVTLLGDVVVKGKLPKMKIKDDAFVTIIQNSVLEKAGTANNVLKRLPMLQGDDGVFEVFGKGTAVIYINNRKLRDASQLDNLSSKDIQSVDIVTNPGAAYDASVKSIIRIRTKRKVGDGFSFDLRSSYYQSENTDLVEQLNMNYRIKGLDIFQTLKYIRDNSLQESILRQDTYVDTLWSQNNTMVVHGKSKKIIGIIGLNYEISPKQLLGAKYTYTSDFCDKFDLEMNNEMFANSKAYDLWTTSQVSKKDGSTPTHNFNYYYNGSFGKLSINYDGTYYYSHEESNSRVTEKSENYENRVVSSKNEVNNRINALKLTFTYPIWKGNLAMGSEYTKTYRKDAYANIENIIEASDTQIKENNLSYFLTYMGNTKLGQFGIGLRYENVKSDYYSFRKLIDEQSKKYIQWFPNASFTTKIDRFNFQLSYTAKTNRPTYRQLSSNVLYANRFTLQSGNPFLDPSIIHDITLVSSCNLFQLMFSYKKEKDAIIYWTQQLDENPAISIIKYKNINKLPSLTIFLSSSHTFGIWTPQLTTGLIKQWLTLESHNENISLKKPIYIMTLNNSFSFNNGFLFNIDSKYRSKGDNQNVNIADRQFVVDLGMVKTFCKDRLSVELKLEDIFKCAKEGVLLYNQKMELYQRNENDSRQFEITLRYKFNFTTSKYKGKGAGRKELKRL